MTLKEIEKIKELNQTLFKELGREPLMEELCTEMGCTMEKEENNISFALSYKNEDYNPTPTLKFRMSVKNNEMEKARKGLGLKQEELGEKVGVSGQTIAKIENCRTYSYPGIREKIAEVLGIPLSVLFPELIENFTEKWKWMRNDERTTQIVSVQSLRFNEVPNIMQLESGDYERMMEKTDAKITVDRILKNLSPKEQEIIEMRYGLLDGVQRNLEEVGKEFGVTRERVRQIEAKCMEKIRDKIQDKGYGVKEKSSYKHSSRNDIV